MVSPRRLLKMKQVLERVPLSVGTMYGVVARREVESIRVGKTILVPEDALDAWLARRTQTAVEE